jgi:phage baseplate assembly protein gpV
MLAKSPTYTPSPPWTDGQQVTRVQDGILFIYNKANNALTVDPNISGVIKDANNFIVKNLPTPTNSGDAANKAYVDGKVPTGGGVAEAPTDGGTYSRRNSAWIKVVDGGAY